MEDKLFHEAPGLPAQDEALIADYAHLGRPLDDLPYTEDFQELVNGAHLRGDTRTARELFQRLLNLRKAARLPRTGRMGSYGPVMSDEEEQVLAGLIEGLFGGTTGYRDRLPYTEEFSQIVKKFNERTGRNLDAHSVWKLAARLAK